MNLLFSDYAENLAYEVKEDFGREFKTWMSEDRNRNAGSRVKVGGKQRNCCKRRNNITQAPQALQWVQMWHSHLGDLATPADIIEALKECGGGEEIILNIRKICN